jgi:hypothetical protein
LGVVLADFADFDVFDVFDVFEVLDVLDVLDVAEVLEVFELLAVFDGVEVFELLAVLAVFEGVEVFEVLDDGVVLVDGAGCWVSVAARAPVMPRHSARTLLTTTVFRLSERIPTSLKAISYRGSAFCLTERSRR